MPGAPTDLGLATVAVSWVSAQERVTRPEARVAELEKKSNP